VTAITALLTNKAYVYQTRGARRRRKPRAITTYDIPIEGRDEWLAAAARHFA
jgi:hypothetical protein